MHSQCRDRVRTFAKSPGVGVAAVRMCVWSGCRCGRGCALKPSRCVERYMLRSDVLRWYLLRPVRLLRVWVPEG